MSSARALCLVSALGLACLAVVCAQSSSPKPTDELQFRSDFNKDDSSSEQPSIPNTNDNDRKNNNNNNNVILDDQDSSDSSLTDYKQQQFNPFAPTPFNQNQFQQFQQRPPLPPFFQSLFGGSGLFDSLRRQGDMMNQRFDQMAKEVEEGEQVSYLSRNGVSYVRTCSTKRA